MSEAAILYRPLHSLTTDETGLAGGKAVSLGRLIRSHWSVPDGFCLTTHAYNDYLDITGLRQRLTLLLERKAFEEMRWEELWDLGLRVRSLFLKTPLPETIFQELKSPLEEAFAGKRVVVRSSSPSEDTSAASFAGLHDSYVNICGIPKILDTVRLVWASLWSDRSLLYRQELGLTPEASAMAVIIQEMVVGDCSGVAFSHCPGRESLAVIEAVWGLNLGLVDGDVEPDRLLLDRHNGTIVEKYAPERDRACRVAGSGIVLAPLPPEIRHLSPLGLECIEAVWQLLRTAETLFGGPQDLEWTFREGSLHVLQARPITASHQATEGERAWYLSLKRSFDALRELRRTIEQEWIPNLTSKASQLASVDLKDLTDDELAAAISERRKVLSDAEESYRELCIPMAHGIRLFGEVYNDRLRPNDPFAFLNLLATEAGLLAVERNQALNELAFLLKDDPGQAARLRNGLPLEPESLLACRYEQFAKHFGYLFSTFGGEEVCLSGLLPLLLQMADAPGPRKNAYEPVDEQTFLDAFGADEQAYARELLDLAKASYRLRDNDNLVIGQLTACLQSARYEATRRLAVRLVPQLAEQMDGSNERVTKRLSPPQNGTSSREVDGLQMEARQLVGQPAGAGLGRGKARVILQPSDLVDFQQGEILVCDAVDPNMTFVVPLAGGIIERRGGMLIHGAIIAREYGLPCVTGVPEATLLINSGDIVTVDGYLGLVTLAKRPSN